MITVDTSFPVAAAGVAVEHVQMLLICDAGLMDINTDENIT